MRNQKGKEISRVILKGLLTAGAIAIAATTPYFVPMIMPKILRYTRYKLKKHIDKKRFQRSFSYLKNQGMINFEYRGKQLYISLTKEGKQKIKKYNVDDLRIKKPKEWDKKWRILIFDVKEKNKIKREALRGKIKELGLFQLQKSVWIYPYDFKKELDFLRNFFSLTKNEMQIIVATEIENYQEAENFFELN
ncbi:MAG: hypothetical protein CO140_04755 [Candidatus Moranbacteria bacterium CG_4_9_14_3_um_filter_40_7]|nr:MAG: hypothetical protein COX31_00165 [Candidatus Moranbacteria bacterium CG23_combo_of_CG06-09_8_20_14_all_40_16]PIU80907.1 MAG: hypothetical protein COS71_01045 [Candidatus Moranbacteria bacterium CG06_land_8_20_14_3_00_40_12]PJA87358.1 MAG: hypothetical protein CO140_04755 [Candidatus Moranbacteria bacterium CG_4_9_14_3_um_filter_40_7]